MNEKEKLTHEQKCQIAAMNANGDTVDDIIKNTGVDKANVESYVEERNRKNGKGKPLTLETIAQVEDLTRKGWTVTDIKAKVGISPASISRIRSGMKTEKEPAPAPTETSSNENIVQVQNTTGSVESQALRGVNVLGVLECALDNAYGTDAEIMSLRADSDTASIVFRYGGTAYSVQFGLAF